MYISGMVEKPSPSGEVRMRHARACGHPGAAGSIRQRLDTRLRGYDRQDNVTSRFRTRQVQSHLNRSMKQNFLASVLLMLVLQWFVTGAAAAKTINVAYPSPSWNTSLPVSMAKEFGLFTGEGLEVQPVYVRGGPVVMAALFGGDADFAVMAGVTAVTSIQRGADIVIVGGHTAYIDQVLIGAKGVTRLGELKGK